MRTKCGMALSAVLTLCAACFVLVVVQHLPVLAQQAKGGPKPEDIFDSTEHGIKIVKPTGELWKFATAEELKDMNKPDTIPTACVLHKSAAAEDPMQVEVYVRIWEHNKKTEIVEKDKKGKEVKKELAFSDLKGVAKHAENQLRERDYEDIKEYSKNEKRGYRGCKKAGIEFSFKAKRTSGGQLSYVRSGFVADNARTYQIEVHVVDTGRPEAGKEDEAAKKGFTWTDVLKKQIDMIFDSFVIYKIKVRGSSE